MFYETTEDILNCTVEDLNKINKGLTCQPKINFYDEDLTPEKLTLWIIATNWEYFKEKEIPWARADIMKFVNNLTRLDRVRLLTDIIDYLKEYKLNQQKVSRGLS